MKVKKLLLILFLFNWLVIWANSALPASVSHTFSDWLIYGVETAFQPEASSEAPSSSPASASEASPAPATSSSSAYVISNVSEEAKETLLGSEWTSDLRTPIRKTAHALEFLTFGVLALLVLAGGDPRRWPLPAAVGIFVALTDETIQIFSKRTSTIKDIWLDLAGFAIGFLIVAGIVALKRWRRTE